MTDNFSRLRARLRARVTPIETAGLAAMAIGFPTALAVVILADNTPTALAGLACALSQTALFAALESARHSREVNTELLAVALQATGKRP